MVLVGTRDAVLALQTDAQLLSRYTPFAIHRWRESDGLRRLLVAFAWSGSGRELKFLLSQH